MHSKIKIVLLSLMLTTATFAGSKGVGSDVSNNTGLPNGKPFQTIANSFEAIETDIANLTSRVTSLEDRATTLEDAIRVLEEETASMQIQIDQNSHNIEELQIQVDYNTLLLGQLRDDITQINSVLEQKQNIIDGKCSEGSAIREVKEEIGLTLTIDELHKIGVFECFQSYPNGIADNEFHHTFISELKTGITNLILDKNEVEAVKLVSLLEFQNLINNIGTDNHFVPSNKKYYQLILKSIKEAIKNP